MSQIPLDTCVHCGAEATRLLSIKSQVVARRCDACGEFDLGDLPRLDKKVVYLDQLAISEIFKIKTGSMPATAPHFDFWNAVTKAVEQCVLLQQVVFPASDIHRDETMVFSRGSDLSLAHEMLAGDVSFQSSWEIERSQLWHYLAAFDQGREQAPSINLGVDEILQGGRNEWLPKLHVSAKMDWSGFADQVRDARERTSEDLAVLYEKWRTDSNTSFHTVLDHELSSFGDARIDAYLHFTKMARRGSESGDTSTFMNGAMSGPVDEFRQLREHFQTEANLKRDDAERRVVDFWQWPINRSMPHHRIQAYLFAAMARKIASGQKRNPTRGALNDIRAIGAYAPYVDAMFVDSEFANYLGETPLSTDLSYKAEIFSLRSREAFLEFLRRIIMETPVAVEQCAVALYGDAAARSN